MCQVRIGTLVEQGVPERGIDSVCWPGVVDHARILSVHNMLCGESANIAQVRVL